MGLRALVVAGVLLASACAGVTTSRQASAAGCNTIAIEARSVPLGPGGARLAPGVRYAGGLSLHGANLHGLSDMKLAADGLGVWAVSDFGALIHFTLRTDRDGRLVGAVDATARPLVGEDGVVLAPKSRADAEGVALMDDGRLLVSFETNDRIWSYGRNGADRPMPVRRPNVAFPTNEGMEGLSAAPLETGKPAWLAIGETGGAWVCTAEACRALPRFPTAVEDGFKFTAADRDPAGGWFVTQRYYSPPLTMAVRVRRMAPDGALGPALIELRPPASVDNFEGIAVRATPTGARLYLLSDDNANFLQQTLLLAFDIPPPSGEVARRAFAP